MFALGQFILEGREVVPCPDLMKWARWFETFDRRIAFDDVNGHSVSTVFLGLDHGWGEGPPLVFETMVFKNGSMTGEEQWRCATYDEAEAQHARAVGIFQRRANMRVIE